MKNVTTGRFGGLFLNAVTLERRSPGAVVTNKRNTTDAGLKRSSMTLSYNSKRTVPHFGGFTLIELLVVVLIIGILSAFALPQYRRAVAKTHLAEMFMQVNLLWQAQQVYFLQTGTYTEDLTELVPSLPAGCQKTSGGNYLCGHVVYAAIEKGGWRVSGASKQIPVHYYRLLTETGANSAFCQIIGSEVELGHFLCASLGGTAVGEISGSPVYKIPL